MRKLTVPFAAAGVAVLLTLAVTSMTSWIALRPRISPEPTSRMPSSVNVVT